MEPAIDESMKRPGRVRRIGHTITGSAAYAAQA